MLKRRKVLVERDRRAATREGANRAGEIFITLAPKYIHKNCLWKDKEREQESLSYCRDCCTRFREGDKKFTSVAARRRENAGRCRGDVSLARQGSLS